MVRMIKKILSKKCTNLCESFYALLGVNFSYKPCRTRETRSGARVDADLCAHAYDDERHGDVPAPGLGAHLKCAEKIIIKI